VRSRKLNNFCFCVDCGFEIRNQPINAPLDEIENKFACLVRAAPQSSHLPLIEAAERKRPSKKNFTRLGGRVHRLNSRAKASRAQENLWCRSPGSFCRVYMFIRTLLQDCSLLRAHFAQANPQTSADGIEFMESPPKTLEAIRDLASNALNDTADSPKEDSAQWKCTD
jgi:hypothetical protein